MLTRILVALDGSDLAEQALPYASALALRSGAELLLVSAIVPPERWIDDRVAARWEQEEEAAAARYLSSVGNRLRDSGVAARTRVAWGRAAEAIATVAADEDVDLVALTTHGRSGIVRWVMGSVADKVVHTSRKPVLLVHAQEEAPAPPISLARILLPLDGSPAAEAVLPFAERLARQLQAKLLLHRVIPPAATLYAGEFWPSSAPALDDIEANVKEYLAGIAEIAKRHGVTTEVTTSIGYPAEAILEAAKLRAADLIALSTHGRSGPERWVMGSVADAVVRHAERPCLVFPVRAAMPATEEEGPGEPTAAALAAGPVVVPPPALHEVEEKRPRKPARQPAKRPHRPEALGRQFR